MKIASLQESHNTRRLAVILAAGLVAFSGVPSFGALALGAGLALSQRSPLLDVKRSAKLGNKLMKASIVAMGAGMNLGVVLEVGVDGLATTAVTLSIALLLGYAVGRVLGVGWQIATLVTVGTAICGGSAIAAMAPVIRARPGHVGVALGVVFLLNAVALFLFPLLGTWLEMDPVLFGRWSALAIHDTSSVVGAAAAHGPEALEIATVTKLARALWILPVVLIADWIRRRVSVSPDEGGQPSVPLFILLFVGCATLVSLLPALQPAGMELAGIGRRGLVVALFFIGLGFTRDTVKSIGARPMVLGLALWVSLGVGSLIALA